jgi:hypothetical protein
VALSVLLLLALGSSVSAEAKLEGANQARENCELAKERQNELAMEYWCSNGAPIKGGKAASSNSGKKKPVSANATKSVPVGGGEAPREPSKNRKLNSK